MAALAFLAIESRTFCVVGLDGLDWIGFDARVPWVLVYVWYLRHSRDIAS